jgi:hypothetical protein
LQEAEISVLEAERREREHQRGKTPTSRRGRSSEAEAAEGEDTMLVGNLAMLQKRVRHRARGKACEWARYAMSSVGLSTGW